MDAWKAVFQEAGRKQLAKLLEGNARKEVYRKLKIMIKAFDVDQYNESKQQKKYAL